MALPDLHSQAKFTQCVPAQSIAGGASVDGADVDAIGYRWMYFVVNLGSVAATGAGELKLQAGSVSGTYADVAGATLAIATDDDNSTKVIAVDLEANTGPHYRLVATGGAGGATLVSADAICIWSKDTTAGGAYAVTAVDVTW
jgi:hypothetical protein